MLAAAVALQGLTGPGQTIGMSVFVDHLVADLDLSRSAVSTAYLVGTLAGAASMPAAGRLIDRQGVRRAAACFGAAFGAVLVAMAGVTGFFTLLIGFAGARALGQGALTLTATTTVAVWFDRRRGLAMGLNMALGGILMSLVPLAAAASIAAVGWRASWVVLGCAVWALVLPLAHWGMASPTPNSVATAPVVTDPMTEPVVTTVSEEVRQPSAPHTRAWTSGQVLRDPRFWVVTAGVALAALIGTALMFHQFALLAERGLSATQAAANFLPQTVAGALAALATGRLADRLPGRVTLPGALVVLAAAPLALQVATPGLTAVLYGVVLGAATTSIRTLEATLLPRWYGTGSIGEIRGIVMAVGVGASAVGPLALALGHDTFGSYGPVLAAFATAPTFLAVAAVALPRRNERVALPIDDVSPS
jgi:MFS family permease